MTGIAPIASKDFETYAAIIRSGQMDAVDVPRFMEENPEFRRWYLSEQAIKVMVPR